MPKLQTTDTSYLEKNGQEVTIIRRLTDKAADLNEVGMMYKAKLEDGTELDVFEDELVE